MTRQWTDELHLAVRYAAEDGFRAGYACALVDVAERSDALDRSWRPVWRRTPKQLVAERIAAMEATFRRLWPDREPFRGGLSKPPEYVAESAAEYWRRLHDRGEPA